MARPFVDRFRTVIEPLFDRRFTESNGIPEAELDTIPARSGYELPVALHDFYLVLGNFHPILDSHHRFYRPDNLTRMDGKLVFCEENQVVLYWAVEEDQGWRTDPPVFQGINNDTVEWYVQESRASDFLVSMIYWQALDGGLP